jgi:hypothetical protein
MDLGIHILSSHYTQYNYIPNERRMDGNMFSWMENCDKYENSSTLGWLINFIVVHDCLASLGRLILLILSIDTMYLSMY